MKAEKCPFRSSEAPSFDVREIIGAVEPKGFWLLGNIPEVLWNILLEKGNFIHAIQRMFARHQTKTLSLKIGPRRKLVVTVDPEIARKILVENYSEFPKTVWEERVLGPVMEGGLIILRNGEEWKHHRQAVASCFGPSRMSELAEIVRKSFSARAQRWDGVVHMSHELRCVVNDVMGRFFLRGHEIEDLDLYSRNHQKIEHGLESRVFSFSKALGKIRHPISYVRGLISRHVIARSLRTDLEYNDGEALDVLLKSLPDQDSVSREILTAVGAGATTGHLLSWVSYLLAMHPRIQHRLRSEILRHAGAAPTLTEIESMPFLTAVVQEALRLYPPAPFLIRQAGQDGQSSAMVLISVWAMHRHPEYWPEPDQFNPDRWLEKRETPAAFIPFGGGPRVCVGKRFAMTEARVILMELLRRFELFAYDSKPPVPISTVLTRPKREIRIGVARRPEP